MESIDTWKKELMAAADAEKAEQLSRFFKCGKGQYGEGDVFVGIMVPQNRTAAKKYAQSPLRDIATMLQSPIHEFRLSALLALVMRYNNERQEEKKSEIGDFYLSHTHRINNWDLVDLSSPQILGNELLRTKDSSILMQLSESDNLWEQRISIVSNLAPIKKGVFEPALSIITTLLHHPHDLIQKANGWMLREIGKKDLETLRNFLSAHAATMPRPTLRYAIEKLSPEERKSWLAKKNGQQSAQSRTSIR